MHTQIRFTINNINSTYVYYNNNLLFAVCFRFVDELYLSLHFIRIKLVVFAFNNSTEVLEVL